MRVAGRVLLRGKVQSEMRRLNASKPCKACAWAVGRAAWYSSVPAQAAFRHAHAPRTVLELRNRDDPGRTNVSRARAGVGGTSRHLAVQSGGCDLEERIAEQGAKVRAMKEAVKQDHGAYSKDAIKAEINILQALKAQLGAAPAGAAETTTSAGADSGGAEELSGSDDESYRRQRWADLAKVEARGGTIFPHSFGTTCSIPEFLDKYARLAAGEQAAQSLGPVRIAGRIHGVRRSGKALVFFDIKGDGARMQLMCDKKHFQGDWEELDSLIKRGDIVGATGTPARNQRSELCVIPSHVQLLAPCVRLLPKEHYGLKDPDARFRNRHVDLLSNVRVRDIFLGRSTVIRSIREYLDARGFLEVETPVLAAKASGAAARPFSTHHNTLDKQLYMRVAPELYLKRLVVGGLDRVYELGKCFRNEGVDATHNPEFTSVEVYQAYADYRDMMVLTEEILAHAAHRVKFKRLDYMEALEAAAGVKFPAAHELESIDSLAFLRELAIKHKLVTDPSRLPTNAAGLLDKLCGALVEPALVQPTFLMHQPLCMSPLAKPHRSIAGLAERFELFVLQREMANAYTELNDPREQAKRFHEQRLGQAAGDEEAVAPDDDFVEALEYALPPTAGWGLGVDRLCMTLLDLPSIREALLFPVLRDKS